MIGKRRVNLTTYTLRVLAPSLEPEEGAYIATEEDKRVLADLPAMIEHAEEELESHLPEGYLVMITEWSK